MDHVPRSTINGRERQHLAFDRNSFDKTVLQRCAARTDKRRQHTAAGRQDNAVEPLAIRHLEDLPTDDAIDLAAELETDACARQRSAKPLQRQLRIDLPILG
mgnify:CR=1 FL=1